MTRWTLAARMLLAASLVLALGLAATTSAQAAHGKKAASPHWVGSWSDAPFDPGPISKVIVQPGFENLGGVTVRNVVRTSIGGSKIRLRLSNRFGTAPLTLDHVTVALTTDGAGIVPGSSHVVRFNGKPNVTIPTGKVIRTDAIPMSVSRSRELSVSLQSVGPTGRVSLGGALVHTTYLSGEAGDFTANADGTPFTVEARNWYFLSGVDVLASPKVRGSVALVGASISAGTGSTHDTWSGYTDLVADRFARLKQPLAVLNAGISGNSLHESSACWGQNGLARLKRDAFDQAGVRAVILDLGVNDLQQPAGTHEGIFGPCNDVTPIDASGMIKLYKEAAERVHAKGLKFYATTLTPFGNFTAWNPDLEIQRMAIDNWIRKTKVIDGYIDFADALGDPANRAVITPGFDSGDGLHPNDAGHVALAKSVSPSLFRKIGTYKSTGGNR